MRYLITYDIEEDDVRGRISKILVQFGTRVQKSVFECDLNEKDLDDLTAKLKKALSSVEAGNIRIYRICGACLKASFGMGDLELPKDDGPCIIVD